MADIIQCKRCEAPMRLQVLDSVSGEDGVLKVAIRDFPVLQCERGHRRFIARDFPVRLLHEVAAREKSVLPAGKKQGLLFRKYHCGKCGAQLAAGGESRPFEFDVELADAPQFRVALTVPVYRCPSCGQEQLRDHGEIESLAPTALAQVFQAAELKPEG